MLQGLDYHYDNFMREVDKLAPYLEWLPSMSKGGGHRPMSDTGRQTLGRLQHEAIAYINTLGQFYEFAKGLRLEALLPRAHQLIPLRHNYTAHRSVDRNRPRRKDDPFIQEAQARAFGFHFLFTASFPVFQIPHVGGHVEFNMRNDHPVIMQQAMDVLQAFHSVPT